MSNHVDEGTLVLNQLRASLDGNRYSLSAVFAAITIAFGGALIVCFFVAVFWHPLKEVYASRHILESRIARIERERKSPFSDGSLKLSTIRIDEPHLRKCLINTWQAKEADLSDKLGLDATIYLRALRMTRNIFLVLTVLLFGSAAPINIAFNLKVKYVANLTKRDVLMLLTPSLLSSTQMIPHVVLGWVANLVVFAILWYNYNRVLVMRKAKFSSSSFHADPVNRTTMILDLPKALRSSEGLRRIFSQAHPRVQPTHVVITQSVHHLHEMVDDYRHLVQKYERLMTTGAREKGPEMLKQINHLAQTIHRARVTDIGVPNSYGFGIYATVKDALLASRKKHDIEVRVAPPPEQIIWRNMKLSRAERGTKQLVVNTLFGVLLLLWVVPSAFIGCFLSNLSRLGAIWPAFGAAMRQNPTAFAILQGFLAPVITTAVFAGLPALFRRFSNMQGKVTRVDREHEVLRKLYMFFFLDNYFIFSIIGVIWDIIAQVLQQTELAKKKGNNVTFREVWNSLLVAQRLATAIVNISSFWVIYLLKSIFEVFLTTAQPIELVTRLFRALNFMRKSTPREVAENSTPQPFQYATNYLSILFNVTIALGFTTIQPLVLPIALILFGLAVPVKKYEILQMKRTNYESNGMYWPLVVDIILFALAFGNLMLLCVVWVQAGWKIAVAAAPLALTVIIFKVITYFKFDPHFYYPDTNESGPFNHSDLEKATPHSKGHLRYQDPVYHVDLERPLLTYEEAFRTTYAKYTGEFGKKDVADTLYEYEPYKSPLEDHKEQNSSYEKAYAQNEDVSYDDSYWEPQSSYGSLSNQGWQYEEQPEESLQGAFDDDAEELHLGAVARYGSSTPYSPLEPDPTYRSSEGQVPGQLRVHRIRGPESSDEERLLR